MEIKIYDETIFQLIRLGFKLESIFICVSLKDKHYKYDVRKNNTPVAKFTDIKKAIKYAEYLSSKNGLWVIEPKVGDIVYCLDKKDNRPVIFKTKIEDIIFTCKRSSNKKTMYTSRKSLFKSPIEARESIELIDCQS